MNTTVNAAAMAATITTNATITAANAAITAANAASDGNPGGTTDIIARLLAPELSEAFDRQFYVENRPGATGNIASDLAAKSAPDGTTLLVVSASFASNVSLYSRVGYDPVRDFTPITRVASVHNLLAVHRALPVKTVREVVDLAKRYPGELSFASPGHGSTPHLALELLKATAGPINVLHIPYRGMAPAVIRTGAISASSSTIRTPAAPTLCQCAAGWARNIRRPQAGRRRSNIRKRSWARAEVTRSPSSSAAMPAAPPADFGPR